MLEKEIETFESLRKDLLQKHPTGGFAVIKGSLLLGVWPDRTEAMKNGIVEYGNTSFLVKNLQEESHIVTFLSSKVG